MTKPQVRCAIYTRKSSEEGLEQSFNSLEAQREASTAYILSQKHEGWKVLPIRYDDGGFSGGTMERPALTQLLNDVQAGEVDIIIVYKVDRLTRSLADFAKIIEILDTHKVSFVSVTQQFNTTSSMGRLTLNVLLSFAQFEREITGERIRDKIAASKQKGMWMGGFVPLGYDLVDRQLVINPVEAETVEEIFHTYVRLGSVRKLKEFLDQKQVHTKVRKSNTGRMWGGLSHSRGALYHLLNNRIYLGEIVHKDQSHPGQHQPIVSRELWDKVADLLEQNNQGHRQKKSQSTASLLSGRIFDSNGIRFTPTHAVKNGKRYRYYTSQTVVCQTGIKPAISRFPAEEIEKLVRSEIQRLLQTPAKCTAGLEDDPKKDIVVTRIADLEKNWTKLDRAKQDEFIRSILKRVTVGQTTAWIEIDLANLLEALLGESAKAFPSSEVEKQETLKLSCSIQLFNCHGEVRIVAPGTESAFEGTPVPAIVKAIARARNWYERIIAGDITSLSQLVSETGHNDAYVRRILQCSMLSPQITEALLAGKHAPDLMLKDFLCRLPLDWQEQNNKFPSALHY